MDSPHTFRLLADAVLVVHVALVLFVLGGLVAIVGLRSSRWVDAWAFRLAHLATIGFVVAESWLGVVCPLTTLELWLRSKARGPTYEGGFIEHWLQALLFWQAPAWVFTVAYTAFGLAVVASWWWFPPGPRAGAADRRRAWVRRG